MKLFECKKCKSLQEEVDFLRKMHSDLHERYLALADARAYQAVKMKYQPNEDDNMHEYIDEDGQSYIVKEAQ